MRSQARYWLLSLVCGLVLSALLAPVGAQAIGIEKLVATNCTEEECGEEVVTADAGEPFHFSFSEPKAAITVKEAEEEGFTQAGGRVPFGVTDFIVSNVGSYPEKIPTAATTHIRTDVAPGLATNPFAVERCSIEELGKEDPFLPESGLYHAPEGKCVEAEIGVQQATIYTGSLAAKEGFGDVPVEGEVFDLVPGEGEHMANGAKLAALYGVSVKLPKFLTEAELAAKFAKLGHPLGEPKEKELIEEQWYSHTLIKGSVEWGKEERGTNTGDFHDYFEIESAPEPPLLRSRLTFFGQSGNGAFITNATSCPGHLTTTLTLTGVALFGPEEGKAGTARSSFTTPIGLTGCEALVFTPAFEFVPSTPTTEQPNEFSATASEEHNPKANDPSQVKSASFTLPEGMTLNPSAAKELTACTEKQAHQEGTVFGEAFGVECPASSKIGTVSLEVPTLDEVVKGSVYLGAPNTGTITGPPYKIYVVADSEKYGVSVRLLGETEPDPITGRVTTYFRNPPEQPFTSLTLKFERGVLAPVANPLLCGEAKGSAVFEPTSKPGAEHPDPFSFNVTGCTATPPPFNPVQATANSNSNAGGNTAFTFNLGRSDGEQYVGSVKTTLPPGLIGKLLPAKERCSSAAAESETEACPAASQIGTATVQAGSGGAPFTFSGPVFLTNSVKGAPYGLSIKVPAVAGPFNLGTVVTVATINVNSSTAQVIVESTLPKIRSGIPLRIRSISVAVNKSGFMINPTNCSALATESTVGGYATLAAGGATASKALSTPFQVGNCSALKFKPKFAASTSAKTSRANGASLKTTLTMPSGQSNIKSVKVQLPKQLPSRLTTLQKACSEAAFAANPSSCPSASFVGTATVKSPTDPEPLTGPAILVSHGGAKFPDLDLVVEDPNHLRVILVGNTDIKNGITTTTFASTPDVPVSSVTVALPTGPHSALGAYGNLCAKPLVMPTTITPQNGGAIVKQNTIISVSGCGVQIVGHKVVGNVAYITVRTFAAGRISGSGKGLKTVFKKLKKAYKTVSLKVPLTSRARGRHKPFKVKLRVGFVPAKKGAHSSATVTVKFR